VAKLRARVAVAEKRLRALDPTTPKRVEQWERDAERLKLTPGLPKAVRDVFAVAINGRDDQQTGLLTQAVRDLDRVRNLAGGLGDPLPLAGLLHLRLLEDRARLETELTTLKAGLPPVATTLVMKERDTPRDTHVMLGGDFLRKGVKVAPGTPAGLPPLPAKPARGERYTRLDLARWLVDPAHPLTARVTVNRFWQQHFGVGLVETENDFGTQGTPPTHPELLDWLASEFVRNGWSVKDLHRLIVTSATYRQSSRARPDLATLDPRNLLLARMPRPRLEAEAVRDSALSASGLLSRKVGGPSVFPPQPEGVSQFTQIRRAWVPSPGADRYRRGLYTHFWRSAPHPGLMVFDAPDSTTACTRRNRSNTPLQALTLLNDAAFQECAVALAGRTLRECDGDDADRLAHAFRLCLARVPSPGEAERLTRFLKAQREAFAADPVGAGKLVPADRPAGISETEGAAWSAVGRVLLNLDEFIVRE
jgi:hypothetical protein